MKLHLRNTWEACFCCNVKHSKNLKLSYMSPDIQIVLYYFVLLRRFFKLENQTTCKIRESLHLYYLFEVHHFPIEYINHIG